MLWIVAIIAAATLLALFAPIHIDIEFESASALNGRALRVSGRWLIFRWATASQPDASPPGGRLNEMHDPAPRTTHRPGSSPWPVLTALRSPGFVLRTLRFIRDMLRALAPRTVRGWIRFGFDEPGLTGVVFGLVQGLASQAGRLMRDVQFEADYAEPVLAGSVRGQWRVTPASVLWPIATYVSAPATWRAALVLVRSRRRTLHDA